MPTKKTRTLNILVSDEEYRHIKKIADMRDMSMGAAIRWSMGIAYMHLVALVPTCPSGTACSCPHLIPRVQPGAFEQKG